MQNFNSLTKSSFLKIAGNVHIQSNEFLIMKDYSKKNSFYNVKLYY